MHDYSVVSIKRKGSLNYFEGFYHPDCFFHVLNEIFLPPCSFFHVLKKILLLFTRTCTYFDTFDQNSKQVQFQEV
jgi:hypothetical protein